MLSTRSSGDGSPVSSPRARRSPGSSGSSPVTLAVSAHVRAYRQPADDGRDRAARRSRVALVHLLSSQPCRGGQRLSLSALSEMWRASSVSGSGFDSSGGRRSRASRRGGTGAGAVRAAARTRRPPLPLPPPDPYVPSRRGRRPRSRRAPCRAGWRVSRDPYPVGVRFHRREVVGLLDGGDRLLPVRAGHRLRQARADGCDKAFHPRYGVVAGQVGDAQPPAGHEHTGDLREDEPRRERVEVLRTDDAVELLRLERHRLGLRHDSAEVRAVVDESSKSGGLTVQDEYGVALLADGRGVRPGCAQHQHALGPEPTSHVTADSGRKGRAMTEC